MVVKDLVQTWCKTQDEFLRAPPVIGATLEDLKKWSSQAQAISAAELWALRHTGFQVDFGADELSSLLAEASFAQVHWEELAEESLAATTASSLNALIAEMHSPSRVFGQNKFAIPCVAQAFKVGCEQIVSYLETHWAAFAPNSSDAIGTMYAAEELPALQKFDMEAADLLGQLHSSVSACAPFQAFQEGVRVKLVEILGWFKAHLEPLTSAWWESMPNWGDEAALADISKDQWKDRALLQGYLTNRNH